jgi:hypothetical protein
MEEDMVLRYEVEAQRGKIQPTTVPSFWKDHTANCKVMSSPV